jgi:hypothetical protein
MIGYSSNFIDQLRRSVYLSATDPQDKMFGLFGFSHGLFGINYPFILRPEPYKRAPQFWDAYRMVEVAHVADHCWGLAFFESAPKGTHWRQFEENGLREFFIE